MILLNLIYVLSELEELRFKCEGSFTCNSCPLEKDKELCDLLLMLPERIATTIYGGATKC